jgi:putative endonuclease
MTWFLYLIECSDDSLYTGIAVDVAARYEQHLKGTGARYTRSRTPRRLLATFEMPDRSVASKAEYAVKRLSATTKRLLASGNVALDDALPSLKAWVAAADAGVSADVSADVDVDAAADAGSGADAGAASDTAVEAVVASASGTPE